MHKPMTLIRMSTDAMRRRRWSATGRRFVLILLAAALLCGALTAVAAAAPVALCVPSAANTAITTPQGDGTCPSGKTKRSLADDADLTAAKNRTTALEAKLAGVTRTTESGITTLKFEGMNVQVDSGSGQTDGALNAMGNLILGYNEPCDSAKHTGSHNLILGTGQAYTSYGSVLGGVGNSSLSHDELLAGFGNTASGPEADVTGGWGNKASGRFSAVTGGRGNAAKASYGSVTGGAYNTASDTYTSITGGGCGIAGPGPAPSDPSCESPTGDAFAAITGGVGNAATGRAATVTGGDGNVASGQGSSVTGGFLNKAAGSGAAVTGGLDNRSDGYAASVAGGSSDTARGGES